MSDNSVCEFTFSSHIIRSACSPKLRQTLNNHQFLKKKRKEKVNKTYAAQVRADCNICDLNSNGSNLEIFSYSRFIAAEGNNMMIEIDENSARSDLYFFSFLLFLYQESLFTR